jgi:hypothetical protein
MTIYEPLFLLIALASVIVLITAAIKAIRGRGKSALRLLGTWAACMLVYFGICVASAARAPRRVMQTKQPVCFDDWCIEIEEVTRVAEGNFDRYRAAIRIFSEAKRVTQREKSVAVCLEDATGHRFDTLTAPDEPPIDTQLGPGQFVTTHREFEVPAGTRPVGIVITHTGFQMGWLVIGEGQSIFHKEPIVHF